MKEQVFSFSGVYSQEGFFPGPEAIAFDLQDLEGTCCYCDAAAIDSIINTFVAKNIVDKPGLQLNWIDTGDYHYMTYLLLRARAAVQAAQGAAAQPVELLLVDNHSDDFEYEGTLSCGNWVSAALRDSLVSEVVYVPGGMELCSLMQKIAHNSSRTPGGENICERPLYVSIDLDALEPECFKTNWDQGQMTFAGLREILLSVRDREIAGIDICGGITLSKGADDRDLEQNSAARALIRNMIMEIFG